MYRLRIPFLLCAFGCFVLTLSHTRADIFIDRDLLTVSNNNITATFRGPDLIRLTNNQTQEGYLRPATPFRTTFDFGLLEPTGKALQWDFWRKGKVEAAQLVLKDLTRTITMNVVLDPDTQDVAVTMWGESLKEGATGLTWGMRGLDLTGGRFVLPVHGGRYADSTAPWEKIDCAWPGDWEAQMFIWESKTNGGFVLYSRDDEQRGKRLRINRRGSFADVALDIEAQAPWKPNGSVKYIEWRINTFKGDWRVPAAGYRSLMHFYRKPVSMLARRTWPAQMQTVVTLPGTKLDRAQLDSLAKRTAPRKTLLNLPDWRKDGYDPNVADYTPREGVKEFVDRAHELGFHVMIPLEPPGADPASGDHAKVRRFLVKDVVTGKEAAAPAPSFAVYNPSSQSYRNLMTQRIKTMLDDIVPDAIFLPGSSTMPNDGNGPIEDKNFIQGVEALHRTLLTVASDIVLASDGMNEVLCAYDAIGRVKTDSPLPPHPISTALFGETTFLYGGLENSGSVPAPSSFTRAFANCESQGMQPEIVLPAGSNQDSDPVLSRQFMLAQLWQSHDFQPDWTGDWKGVRFRWRGADGTVAVAEQQGGGVRLKVGDQVVYRRSRGAATVGTPLSVAGWRAYDDNALLGLDPACEYWLDEGPRAPDAVRLSALGLGAKVAAGNVGKDGAYAAFDLAPAKEGFTGPVSISMHLPPGTKPAGFAGCSAMPQMTGDNASFAEVSLPSTVVVFLKLPQPFSLPAILLALPHESLAFYGGAPESSQETMGEVTEGVQAQKSANRVVVPARGRTICAWYGRLPDSGGTLSFAAGTLKSGSADSLDFSVRVNGETIWTKTEQLGHEAQGSADLAKWKGQPVLIQLVAENRADRADGRAAWVGVEVK